MNRSPIQNVLAHQRSLGLRRAKWTQREAIRQWLVAHSPCLLPRMFAKTDPNSLGILMYHRIAESVRGETFPTSNVTPRRFRSQLEGLLRLGYQPWSLKRVIECHRSEQALPNKVFAVTFDDGYECNFTNARPILESLAIPATIFVSTAYIDQNAPFPFDDWEVSAFHDAIANHWRPIRSHQILQLVEEGLIDIGSHSHTHSDFRNAPHQLRKELEQSMEILISRFGVQDRMFSFPYGKSDRGFANNILATVAKEAGMVCGLTSDNRLACISDDPFTWGRIAVTQADSHWSLEAKLDNRYARIRSLFSLRDRTKLASQTKYSIPEQEDPSERTQSASA